MSVTIFINLQIVISSMKRILIMVKMMLRLLIWSYCQRNNLCSHNYLFKWLHQWKNNHHFLHHKCNSSKICDSFEENCEVEDGIQEEIVGEFFVQVDEKEKLCFDAIYVDFSKYFSWEKLHMPCSKENSRMSFFQVGVSDVWWYLPLFLVKIKIKKMSK